jgi:hypothetical protein
MKIDNTPQKSGSMTLAKFSGWVSGLSWFLMFSVIFTDEIFGMGDAGSEPAIYLCIGPMFLITILGYLTGIITGLIAKGKKDKLTEEDQDFAANGVKYGLMGIAFVILAPLINQLIEPLIGIQLYDVTAFFR